MIQWTVSFVWLLILLIGQKLNIPSRPDTGKSWLMDISDIFTAKIESVLGRKNMCCPLSLQKWADYHLDINPDFMERR